jgi:hypothetical protein
VTTSSGEHPARERHHPRAARGSRSRGLRAWLPLTLAVATVISGCAGIQPDPRVAVASSPGGASAKRLSADDLRKDFEDFAAKLPGEVALAWAAVGSRHEVQSLGSVRDEAAWSTAKVPLGVARLRLAGGKLNDKTSEVLRRAITRSDNAAAKTLWQGLGTPQQAVALMGKVVRDAGDEATSFNTAEFGLSPWTVPNQAQFAAGLPCIPDGPSVLDLMDEVIPQQSWGLGKTGLPAQFKGGWGIGPHGLLVRQLGVLTTSDGGQIGVAIATMPHTKTTSVAESNMDAVASWIAGRLGPADAGRCT